MEYKQKATLIYGEIQSGKTKYMLEKCSEKIQDNYSVIIVLINKNCCTQQLKQRIELFNDEEGKNEIVYELFGKNTQISDKNKCYITLYNKSKMILLSQYLDLDKERKFVLFPDEADDHVKLKADVYVYYKKILDKISEIYYITATTYRILFNDLYLNSNTIEIIIPDEKYISIEKIKFKIDNDMSLPNGKKYGYFEETDKNFNKYIKKLSKKQYIKTQFEDEHHPIICLYKSNSDNNSIHSDIYSFMKNNYPNWITIIYNGSDTSSIRFFMNEDNRFEGTLPQLLSYIKNRTIFPHILIISGRYADRMITFASEDFRWHLSHLRFPSSKNTSCVSLLQQCRILGVFPTIIKKQICCTQKVKDDIINAYNLQKKLIDEIRTRTGNVSNVLKEIKIPYNLNITRKIDTYVKTSEVKDLCVHVNEDFEYHKIDVNNITKESECYKITKLAIQFFIENKITTFTERKIVVSYIHSKINKSEENIRGVLSFDKKDKTEKVKILTKGFLYIKKKEERDKYFLLYL